MKQDTLTKKASVKNNATTDGDLIKELEKKMSAIDANHLIAKNVNSMKEEDLELIMSNALIVMRTIT